MREHRPAKFAPQVLLPQLSNELLKKAQAHIEEQVEAPVVQEKVVEAPVAAAAA